MKKFNGAVLAVFLVALAACGESVKEEGPGAPRPIFTNDGVRIEGHDAGIFDKYPRVYLTRFADFTGDVDVSRLFYDQLENSLKTYHLQLVKTIRSADAVVSGELLSLSIRNADTVTNIDGDFYRLRLAYSVADDRGRYLQRSRQVEEVLLVFDRESYPSNTTMPYFIEQAAQHTADAVYYGWQVEYSRSLKGSAALGGTNATNSGTNRTE